MARSTLPTLLRGCQPQSPFRFTGGKRQSSRGVLQLVAGGHQPLNLVRVLGNGARQQLRVLGGDEDFILDAHAEAALRNVDAWLDGDDGSGRQRGVVVPGVVHLEPDEVAAAMNVIVAVARL